MFAFLEGTIVFLEEDATVIAVGGVGYRVATPRAPGDVGDWVRLFVAEVIREDRFDIYGFPTRDELAFFHRLVAIDGVGPKMAVKILSAGTLDAIRARVQAGDVAFLTSISGVGKKTAQKIVLELKGVLVDDAAPSGDHDVVDALLNLGYSRADITPLLAHIMGETPEERVRHALQMLGKHSRNAS